MKLYSHGHTEAYSEPTHIYKIVPSAKANNNLKPLTISTKRFITDTQTGSQFPQ